MKTFLRLTLLVSWFGLMGSLTRAADESQGQGGSRDLKPIKIAMIGDSTMASYSKPPEDRSTLSGWGQVFGLSFNDKVTVLNHARSGRSSKSYLREGLWQPVLREKPLPHGMRIKIG